MTPNDFVKAMLEELKAISLGQSKLTNGAILFDPKKLPFCQALDRFVAAPTKEVLKEVIKMAEQDFGGRFGKFVDEKAEALRTGFFKEQPTPPPAPAPEVPFKQALYSELSTILGRGREMAIDQRLLDVLVQDVNRLATVFQTEIQKQSQAEAKRVCELAITMLGQELDKLNSKIVMLNNKVDQGPDPRHFERTR